MLGEIWNTFTSKFNNHLILNEGLTVDNCCDLHNDLIVILKINNGQIFTEKGIFVRPKPNILDSTAWVEYKYLDYNKILQIIESISLETDLLGEIPFAISGDMDDIGECITINRTDGRLSLVSFGGTPKNYEERNILRYVRSSDSFGSSMSDFLSTQTTFKTI